MSLRDTANYVLQNIDKVTIEVVERVDPRTTGGIWKTIRDYSAIISGIGGLVLISPITLPLQIGVWVTWITAVSGFIAGGSNLDKSKKLIKKL